MKSKKIAVFAGTAEGHELARYMAEKGHAAEADFFVATDYGKEIYRDIESLSVAAGRLDAEEIESRLNESGYEMVIDATHPYAGEVTANLQRACGRAGILYIRLLREESIPQTAGVSRAASVEEAAAMLAGSEEKFLLTTGAKELHKFRNIKDFRERAVARVLPSAESLDKCLLAGLKKENIICMQGPFTKEMNIATMRQYDAQTIVTKSTGKAGGFENKAELAEEGFRVIVIERPRQETGLSISEVKERIDAVL